MFESVSDIFSCSESVRLRVLVESLGNKNVKTHRKTRALPPPSLRGAPLKENEIKNSKELKNLIEKKLN